LVDSVNYLIVLLDPVPDLDQRIADILDAENLNDQSSDIE